MKTGKRHSSLDGCGRRHQDQRVNGSHYKIEEELSKQNCNDPGSRISSVCWMFRRKSSGGRRLHKKDRGHDV